MSFLPEDDQDYLQESGLEYEELIETSPEGTERRGVLFPRFGFVGQLFKAQDGALVPANACDLLVMIPPAYATTKLDSFYTDPRLVRAAGGSPQNTEGESVLFGRKWQFWSRHLDDSDWRVGVDGLRTFISYIRAALRSA